MEEAANKVLGRVREEDVPLNVGLAAGRDARLASISEAYMEENFYFGAHVTDRTLYILVALIYLVEYDDSHDSDDSVTDFAASSGLQAGELLLLSEFGKTLNSESLRNVEDDAEVGDFLNKLYFCNSLGIEVSRSENCEAPIQLDACPLKPAKLGKRCHGSAAQAVPIQGRRPRDAPARTRSLFELMDMVTQSSRFVSLPANAWTILGAIDRSLECGRCREEAAMLHSLRDFAVQVYSQVVYHGRRWEVVDDIEPTRLPLRAAEARDLLLAREHSPAVNLLVFTRRLRCLLSHEMVVADGTERARLYLLRAGLRVSYNLPLTYEMLATDDPCEYEREVSELMTEFIEVFPSTIDKVLRQYTLNLFWFDDEASYVLNLAPEDYLRAGGLNMDSRAADVYRKIPFPVGLQAEEDVPRVHYVLCTVNRLVDSVGSLELSPRFSWLFPHGQPSPDEMLQVIIARNAELHGKLSY